MSTPWWAGIASATTTIDCGGHEHRLEWSDGDLRALDHPDVEGDRTLAALGGDAYPCLAALDDWSRHRDDLRLLLLASRGPSDPVQPLDPSWTPWAPGGAVGMARGGGSAGGWVGNGAGGVMISSQRMAGATPPGPDAGHLFGGVGLLNLGGGLTRRLVATVAVTWDARLRADDERARDRRPELHAALYGRVVCTIREWLDDADAAVDVVMSDGERGVERSGNGYLVTLPFSWIYDVWARGLSTVGDELCLAAVGGRDEVELEIVDRELARRTMTLSTNSDPAI